jgi:putative membrane protein
MSLVSAAEQARIEESIRRAEARTDAEIVVAVLPRAEDHWRFRALASAVIAIASAVAYFELVPWGAEAWGLVLQLPIGIAAWALTGIGPVHRRLFSAAEADRAARGAAFRVFAERGIHRTKHRTGVLVLIAELEHRAVILGDEGVHARVHDEGWARHVEHLVRRIREGRTADGIVEVVTELEDLLAAHFPRSPGDVNELPDAVVRGGRG